MNAESCFRYWGKAPVKSTEKLPYHLLPYHCLDVAAVGKQLLSEYPNLAEFFAGRLGIECETFCRYAIFMLTLHDIGKFSETFQSYRPDLLKALQGRERNRNSSIRHDTLGFLFWRDDFRNRLINRPKERRARSANPSLDDWIRAVTGHHGKPPRETSSIVLSDYFTCDDIEAASEFIRDAGLLLLGDEPVFPELDSGGMAEASWLLAGFSVLCDWLGSNESFFSYCTQVMPLPDYWERAQQNAKRALQHAGILPNELSESFQLSDCFPDSESAMIQPTPLQALAAKLPLDEKPLLLILEDVTGTGKTEAALLLAYRLMRQRATGGFYFALPTMATANGMYRRMKSVYRRMFSLNSTPSLVLAHSARELSSEFNATVLPEPGESVQEYGDDTEPAEALCSAWLADNRKTALLAPAGIGTIDQALLSVMPSRHQSLRLFGLLGKVLIVDEVHAFDAYTNRLLRELLTIHARLGGSAILLSATLPLSQRQKFMDAFTKGRKASKATLEKTDFADYPLLSLWQDSGVMEQPLDTRDSVKRTVQVKLLHQAEAIEPLVQQILDQGKCLCWIRNTVADARETFANLRRRYPDGAIDLFHARFALQDRLDIENRTLDRFGPGSGATERSSQVLIATQVVEQSLDLDFDVLITDLAPVDLIIQRAGRLCRHPRDEAGNRINGRDRRGEPVLYVYTPDPSAEADAQWFTRFFPRTGKVYPHHGQLWLTANLLKTQPKFTMPADARRLIEGVYGDEAQDRIPEGLQKVSENADGGAMAGGSLAAQNTLNWDCGYRDSVANRWWDEALTPTRLGEDRVTVYLARWIEGELVPWVNEEPHRWQRSAVQLRQPLAAGEGSYEGISAETIAACKLQLPAKGKWGVLLPLRQRSEQRWIGYLRDVRGNNNEVAYDIQRGLVDNLSEEGEG